MHQLADVRFGEEIVDGANHADGLGSQEREVRLRDGRQQHGDSRLVATELAKELRRRARPRRGATDTSSTRPGDRQRTLDT
jgi:hypothetical protein